MSEQELREGLRAAVADEPALSFDPDALMVRAQREIKRRRALFGAGTATVAVAVAAVAVPTMLGSPRGGGNPAGSGGGWPADGCASGSVPPSPTVWYRPSDGPGPSFPYSPSGPSEPPMPTELTVPSEPPSASFKVVVPSSGAVPTFVPVPSGPRPTEPPEPSASPCPPSSVPPPSSSGPPTASGSASANQPQSDFPWPPPDAKQRHYTAAQLTARGAEMRAHLTTDFGRTVSGATDVSVEEFGGESTGAVADGQNYLNSFTGYARNGVHSAVAVAVFSPGDGPSPSQACSEGSCSVQQLTAGDRLVITKIDAGNGAEIVTVTHYRTDGAVVAVSGYNYDPTAKTAMQPQPSMPVTIDQLTKLATDPALGI